VRTGPADGGALFLPDVTTLSDKKVSKIAFLWLIQPWPRALRGLFVVTPPGQTDDRGRR